MADPGLIPPPPPESLLGRLFSDRLPLVPRPDRLEIPAHGAAYALGAADGTILQLLETQSLRRAVETRLLEPPASSPGRRADLREVATTLWWRPAYSRFETAFVYLQLARQLLGPGYRRQLAWLQPWYARCDRSAKARHWAVGQEPFGPGGQAVGPFTTRARANAFVAALDNMFDLCRYPQEVARAPHGQRCAYFDMGKCPAPCDGTVPLAVHENALQRSAAFVAGHGDSVLADWRERMAEASAALNFEAAQRCKERLDSAAWAARAFEFADWLVPAGKTGPNRPFSADPRQWRCLTVQRGRSPARVRPFFCAAGHIDVGAEVRLRELDSAAEAWAAYPWPSDNDPAQATPFHADGLALLAHFAAQGSAASGIYLIGDILGEPGTMARMVREYFASSPPQDAAQS